MRSIDEIRAEWREALKEHQAAVEQYEPFIVTGTLSPGVNPLPVDYEALKAAYDRLEKAQAWLGRIRQEFHEAVRNKEE